MFSRFQQFWTGITATTLIGHSIFALVTWHDGMPHACVCVCVRWCDGMRIFSDAFASNVGGRGASV